MNNLLILLDDMNCWKPYLESKKICLVSDYLKNRSLAKEKKLVLNLSDNYGYNTEGYYCSLLAQTRRHKVIPSVEVINKIESDAGMRLNQKMREIFLAWLATNSMNSDHYELKIYFGRCMEKGLERIARYIFEHYPAPLLKVVLTMPPHIQLDNVRFMSIRELSDEEEDFFAASLESFNTKVWTSSRSSKSKRYSLAILYDPNEKFPPSNKKALSKLMKLAYKMDIHAELITEEDSTRLMEFDALFIRTTTSLNHYTFRFSQIAEQYDIAVIDDPTSIIRCTNKVYLNELFAKEKISSPESLLLFKSGLTSFEEVKEKIGLPFILKIPDGSFSLDMKKITSDEDMKRCTDELFEKSEILLAQEYIPTDYDWRIGLLDGEPLFACKYYMAKGHWQIYHHCDSGRSISGLSETLPIYQVPRKILETAQKAASLIGKGLYGVDLKMKNDKIYVIEINDNPNIDYGIEDAVLGDELYYRLLTHFGHLLDIKRFL